MSFLDRHVLRNLERIDGLEDREALSDRVDSNVPQRLVVEVHQDLSRNAVF